MNLCVLFIRDLTNRRFQHKFSPYRQEEDAVSRERYPFPKEMELSYDEGIFARSALTACLTDDECRLAGIPDTAAGRTVLVSSSPADSRLR